MTADTPRPAALAQRLAELSPQQRAQLERRLAQRARTGTSERTARIPQRAAGGGPLPLSWSQEHVWRQNQVDLSGAAWSSPVKVKFEGDLDVDLLRLTFQDLVSRHEILRTTYGEAGGISYQRVHDDVGVELGSTDLRDSTDIDAEVKARLADEAGRPFNLAEGPLFRAALLRTADDVHILSMVLHHILTDEQSTGPIIAEFVEAYDRRRSGRPAAAAPRLQYADFAVWQRAALKDGALSADVEGRVRRLAGMPAEITLPVDRPRPPRPTGRGGAIGGAIGSHLWNLLRELARQEGCTEVMVLMAVFQTLLSHYSGQDDITISLPTAGRDHPDLEGMLGCFFNTLVVRCDLSGAPSFRTLLGQVRETCLEAYDHREVPFVEIVEAVAAGRRNPLLQTMLIFEREGAGRPLEFAGLRMTPLQDSMAHRPYWAKRDLTLVVVDQRDTARVELVYDADLFTPATAEDLHDRYLVLLSSLIHDPDGLIDRALRGGR